MESKKQPAKKASAKHSKLGQAFVAACRNQQMAPAEWVGVIKRLVQLEEELMALKRLVFATPNEDAAARSELEKLLATDASQRPTRPLVTRPSPTSRNFSNQLFSDPDD